MDVPSVGARISFNGHHGSIKFVGPVDGTSGLWLGVEWDDPSRGKHDGLKNGKRYFTCSVPNSGSFIRPSPNVSRGKSFLDALVTKYVETPHGTAAQESVLLGSSHGAIQVEAVNLDKIRKRLSKLEHLREVSLDDQNVSRGDAPGRIRSTCPNIQGLDLSNSLLESWHAVSCITVELPILCRLSLNRNRLKIPPSNNNLSKTSFSRLKELYLNDTMTGWLEIQAITSLMPELQVLELGYNRLTWLPRALDSFSSNIKTINLDSNELCDWKNVCAALAQYPSIQRVILASNRIDSIPFPEDSMLHLQNLKHISLSNNNLRTWKDIDALSVWCPILESLTLNGNPIVVENPSASSYRPLVIAKIPFLLVLNGATISRKERSDCELFYLSYIERTSFISKEERLKEHPRYRELREKYGREEEEPVVTNHITEDRLLNRLIELKMYQCAEPPVTHLVRNAIPLASQEPLRIRVLPTMSLRLLRLKIRKAGGHQQCVIQFWLTMPDDTSPPVELGKDNDSRTLDWLGIEDGSEILYLPTQLS